MRVYNRTNEVFRCALDSPGIGFSGYIARPGEAVCSEAYQDVADKLEQHNAEFVAKLCEKLAFFEKENLEKHRGLRACRDKIEALELSNDTKRLQIDELYDYYHSKCARHTRLEKLEQRVDAEEKDIHRRLYTIENSGSIDYLLGREAVDQEDIKKLSDRVWQLDNKLAGHLQSTAAECKASAEYDAQFDIKIEGKNFMWALQSMKAGRKVRLKNWGQFSTLGIYEGGFVSYIRENGVHKINLAGERLSLSEILSGDWELYE